MSGSNILACMSSLARPCLPRHGSMHYVRKRGLQNGFELYRIHLLSIWGIYDLYNWICNSQESIAINSVINLGCNLPSLWMHFLGHQICTSATVVTQHVEATDSMTLISQREDLGGISFLLEGLPHYPMFYFSIEVWKCLVFGNLWIVCGLVEFSTYFKRYHIFRACIVLIYCICTFYSIDIMCHMP